MPVVSVRIPQMGEGLQEARLVEFLKQPGDAVRRDEPIYVMETDKAITEVECPYEGKLVEWVAEPNAVLPIGTEVGRMEVAEGVTEIPLERDPTGQPAGAQSRSDSPATVGISRPSRTNRVPIPPRTRKYLREKGLLDQVDQIPAAGKKLMPEDVDRFLAAGPAGITSSEPLSPSEYRESPLPPTQQTLNFRLQRGAEACVPATISVDVNWEPIQRARGQTRDTTGETGFSMLLWCITQAMREHAGFRSSLSPDGKTLRTYHHVNLGVAVAIPGDLLRTAVVRDADQLDRKEFHENLKQQIERVRDGEDQIDATTTVTVSNIGSAGVSWGVPVVVTPAVATLALGQVEERPVPHRDGFRFKKMATLTLTFDHRIINGVGAANFLSDVRQRVESFSLSNEGVTT